MTQLRDAYIEALIENVRRGDIDAIFLDRIERLLSIEHGATVPVRFTDVPTTTPPDPAPPHEEPQETGIAARPPLDALSAPDKESPAPSPDRKHSPLIGLQPTVKHEEPEQATEAKPTPRAEEEALASDPPAPASPAPMAAPNGDTKDAQLARAGWTPEKRQAASDRQKARWEEKRRKEAGETVPGDSHDSGGTLPETEGGTPVVSVHVSPDASAETLGALASVAEKAIEAIESGEITRIVDVKRGKAKELPPCTCEHQFAVSGPGHWHDESCPRHACKYTLPPAAGLDGKAYEAVCQGCGKPKVYDPGESMYNGHPVRAKDAAGVLT